MLCSDFQSSSIDRVISCLFVLAGVKATAKDPEAAQTATKTVFTFLDGGSAPTHTPRKSAATAASRGPSLLEFGKYVSACFATQIWKICFYLIRKELPVFFHQCKVN